MSAHECTCAPPPPSAVEAAEAAVRAAATKVEKLHDHLAGAEKAFEQAQRDLAAARREAGAEQDAPVEHSGEHIVARPGTATGSGAAHP